VKFSKYRDFDDFCLKNNFTPIEGLAVLDKEFEKRTRAKTKKELIK